MPRRSRGRASSALRRWALPTAAVAVLGVGLQLAAPARAEEVFTSQAAAAHATDSTWIPAPTRRAAVCIVDTGTDVTPDTTNVVARFSAVDAGDGTDRSPQKHGTLMATIAAAPYNGFGMVGAAPSIDVVSVRASADGVSFGGSSLRSAIQLCISYRNIYNIKVVSLSLGGPYSADSSNAAQINATQTMIDQARYYGLNVVAAAGNSAVGAVDWPAGYEPALAVGAATGGGARCSFASWGPAVDVWAPGCPLDVARPDSSGGAAWASGSSEAAAFVAATLTQLRALDPALSVDGAERLLTTSARGTDAGAFLDVERMLVAGGLEEQVTAGHTATPAPATPPTMSDEEPVQPSASTSPAPQTPMLPSAPPVPGVTSPTTHRLVARLPKPVVRSLVLRRGVLTVTFSRKPTSTEAHISLYLRRPDHPFPTLARRLRVRGDRVRTRISGTLHEVSITYEDATGIRRTSPVLTLHPKRVR